MDAVACGIEYCSVYCSVLVLVGKGMVEYVTRNSRGGEAPKTHQ